MTDRDTVLKTMVGEYRGVDDVTDLDSTMRKVVRGRTIRQYAFAADSGTAADLTESLVCSIPSEAFPDGAKVVSATVMYQGAVTASDSAYETFLLQKRNAAGASAATVATQTTKITGGSGNVAAFVPFALTLTGANVNLVAGGQLTITKTKASTGTPIGSKPAYLEIVLEAL